MLELLLAFGVFVFFLSAAMALQLKALRSSEDAGRRARASMLARDYLNRAAVAPAHMRTAPMALLTPYPADCRSSGACTPERFAAFLIEDWMGVPAALHDAGYSTVARLPGGRFCQVAAGPGEAIALAWPALSAVAAQSQPPHCPMPGSASIQYLTLWGYGGPFR